MERRAHFVAVVVVVFLTLALASVSGATAQEDYDNWIARLFYVHVWPGSDTLRVENPVEVIPPIFTDFFADGGNGFGAEVEYLFRPQVGVWVGLDFTNMKTNLSLNQGSNQLYADDRVDMRALGLGGNYHFMQESRVDIYAGLLVSWVNYSSSSFYFAQVDQEYRLDYDNELSWGFNAGVDIPFTRDGSWFGSVAVRYLFLALEDNSGPYALTVDPVQGYFGIGYSWW